MTGQLTATEGLILIRLCDRIGMLWEWHPKRDGREHAWNGHALNLAHGAPNGTSDLVHEVAHWLVAPPIMRRHADFGLESDNKVWATTEEVTFADRDAVGEELHASMLGILLERALGFDWRYTWRFHSWDGGEDCRPIICELQQRGLIRGLVPTCLLSADSD